MYFGQYKILTVVSRKYAPPFATLALVQSAGGGGGGGGLYAGCDIFSRDYALPRSRNMSGSVDAGFVLHALLFHHGDLEPDCIGVSTRGGTSPKREASLSVEREAERCSRR